MIRSMHWVLGVLAATLLAPGAASAEKCVRTGSAQFFDAMSVCVSSALAPQAGNSYGPGNLSDGDDRTAWCEGAKGTTGAYIALRVKDGPPFRRLVFSNGYAKSKKAFLRNARPRTIQISTDTGHTTYHELPDSARETVIDLPDPALHELTITIVDVYPGTRYNDACLNEFYADFEYEELLLQQE